MNARPRGTTKETVGENSVDGPEGAKCGQPRVKPTERAANHY